MNYQALGILVSAIAVFSSAVIALLLAPAIQRRKEHRDRQFHTLETLIGTSHIEQPQEAIEAFNTLDLVFYEHSSVRAIWHELHAMLEPGRLVPGPRGKQEREAKRLELLVEMARVLGYKDAADCLRHPYLPPGSQR